jgi:hypothetical protein
MPADRLKDRELRLRLLRNAMHVAEPALEWIGFENRGGGGIDFECDVDCDGGGVTVTLANNDGSVIVKLDHIRIWKGDSPDVKGALQGGDDHKVFRLDGTALSECSSLVAPQRTRRDAA